MRRQNSVAETKIFTKILQYTRSDLSLPCVVSLRNKRFRLVLEEKKTEERDFWFWPIFRTVYDSRSETARKRLLRKLRVTASVTYTSATFVSRLKFMINSSLHGTLSLKLGSNVNLEDRGSRMVCF